MQGYSVLMVDGKLAIQWDDETLEQAVERARGERIRHQRRFSAATPDGGVLSRGIRAGMRSQQVR
jgi:hypothetical protein